MEEKNIIKDLLLKKCLWFYEFKDIFYKYPIISPWLLIEWEQPARCDGVSINDSKLGSFNFDLEEILETHEEIKDMELRLLLINHNGNDNLDSDLHFVFFQIAWDKQQNEIQKQQANTNQEKELKRMAKLLRSNRSSKNESKNRIIFVLLNVSCFIQPFYLKSRRDRLESKTSTWSNNCNQKCPQKNNRSNAQQNDKEPTQSLSQKRNYNCIRQFSPICTKSSIRQLSSEL